MRSKVEHTKKGADKGEGGGSPLSDLEGFAVNELSELLYSGTLKPTDRLRALAVLERLLDRQAARGVGDDLTSDVLAWASSRGIHDQSSQDSPFGPGVLSLGDCGTVPSYRSS